MRIERTGAVEPLTPRFEAFLRERLSGQRLDDLQSPERRRIDYTCLNGLIAIEIKTLAEDASERLDNLTAELEQRADWPVFYGTMPAEGVLRNLKNPEEVRRRMLDRLGRAVVSHLKKANEQLGCHVADFPRKNVVRVLMLLNEDHEEYEPDSIAYVVMRALKRDQSSDWSKLCNLDYVVYISERHACLIDGSIAFPTLTVSSEAADLDPWKEDVLARLISGWAAWNSASFIKAAGNGPVFSTIDHIPDQMPRHELWRLTYRRNPYLQGLSKEQLRDRFDEAMLRISLSTLMGCPIRVDFEHTAAAYESFTHVQEEMASRGLPITEFPHDLQRQIDAASRLSLPASVAAWLRNLSHSRTSNIASLLGSGRPTPKP